jgi:hypothetical protein
MYTKEGIPQQVHGRQAILSISATNKNGAIFSIGIKIHKFDSIKEILEA